jgi:hypothetical protein
MTNLAPKEENENFEFLTSQLKQLLAKRDASPVAGGV